MLCNITQHQHSASEKAASTQGLDDALLICLQHAIQSVGEHHRRDIAMEAIKAVMPQIPKELQLSGTSLATQLLEDWAIWSLESSPGPTDPI